MVCRLPFYDARVTGRKLNKVHALQGMREILKALPQGGRAIEIGGGSLLSSEHSVPTDHVGHPGVPHAKRLNGINSRQSE